MGSTTTLLTKEEIDSKDLSIFNSLDLLALDSMICLISSVMLGGNGVSVQSNYPPYNIKAGKDKYAIEVALAGFNKNDVEVEYEDNLLTVKTKQVKSTEKKMATR